MGNHNTGNEGGGGRFLRANGESPVMVFVSVMMNEGYCAGHQPFVYMGNESGLKPAFEAYFNEDIAPCDEFESYSNLVATVDTSSKHICWTWESNGVSNCPSGGLPYATHTAWN